MVTTREPGGSPAGERIRKLLVEGEPGSLAPMTEALLHFAQRAEHIEKTIAPALARGAWVVCDRFADSTMAYQGYGHGLGRAPIQRLCRAVCGDLAPALTLIFDVPVEIGLARAAKRRGGEARFEAKGRDYHERVRQGFIMIAKAEPKRCVVIDAARDVGIVSAAALQAIRERLAILA